MNSFQDIYYNVDSRIVEKGFWNLNINGKKELVDNELKRYMGKKVEDIYGIKLINESSEFSATSLLRMIANVYQDDEKKEELRHFTHYILNIAGAIQNNSIIWWQEDEEAFQNMPTIIVDEDNRWSELKIHTDTDYLETFEFVYDAFQSNFPFEKGHKKLLKENK